MDDGLILPIQGEQLRLLPERAALWTGRRTLLVADAHFGKPATFRAAGIPIPLGTTERDLGRLSQLVARWQPERLVILGDFFHARQGRDEETMDRIAKWRAQHAALAVELVRGNHDRHAGDPPEAWKLACTTEPIVDPPFVFRHEPLADARGYVVAGHLHPGLTLREPGGKLRVPCFLFRRAVGVLPAFSSFTGLATVSLAPQDRAFAVGEGSVVEVTG